MSVTERLISIKQQLVEADREAAREAAMLALVKYVHYKIAPRVEQHESYPVFNDAEEMKAFQASEQLDGKALDWVVGEMRKEDLIEEARFPVTLTMSGIGALCK